MAARYAQYVPVISIKDIDDPEVQKIKAKELYQAGIETGFFCITDHGVDPELVDRMFKHSKAFFELPVEEKKKYNLDPFTMRGYDQLENQSLGDSGELQDKGRSDFKEALQFGTGFKTPYFGRFAHGPNMLPPDEALPGLREDAAVYYKSCLDVVRKLSKVFALSIGLDPELGVKWCEDPIAAVRMLHYPPQRSTDSPQIGAGAHSDFGILTLLATNGTPGLQLYIPSIDQWIEIEPPSGSFVVNIGDIGSAFTGGLYKSSLHRVVNTSTTDHRYSMPFFMDGNSDVPIKAFPGFEGETKFSQSDKIKSVEEHMILRFNSSYENYREKA